MQSGFWRLQGPFPSITIYLKILASLSSTPFIASFLEISKCFISMEEAAKHIQNAIFSNKKQLSQKDIGAHAEYNHRQAIYTLSKIHLEVLDFRQKLMGQEASNRMNELALSLLMKNFPQNQKKVRHSIQQYRHSLEEHYQSIKK